MNQSGYESEFGRLNINPKTPLFSIVTTEKIKQLTIIAGKLRFINDARELKCNFCQDWWPWDTEFYSPHARRCRACESERKKELYKLKKGKLIS